MAITNDSPLGVEVIAETVSAILWEVDPESLCYRYVSAAAERLLGYPVEDWTSQPDFWVSHLHEEDRDWAPLYCREASAERREFDLHYRMIAADGRTVWLQDHVTVVTEDASTVRRVGISIDVTAEREAANRLRERERHLRLLLDSTSEPICSIDTDNRCTYANRASVRELGFAGSADLLGNEMHALIHHTRPDGSPYPSGDCPLAASATSLEGIRVDSEWFIRADGSLFPVTCSSNPMIGEEGAVEGCVMAFRDVTEDRRVRTELRRASAVFDYAAEGIFIVDPGLRTTAVNRAYTRMTGYALSDLGAGPPPPLGSDAGRDGDGLARRRFDRDIRPVLRSTGLWEGELWGQRHDGEKHPYWLSLSVVQDDDGEPSQYIGLLSDIAELKQYQERLHHLAHHDALTGLPNRLLFHDRLEQALARARRSGTTVALAFLDIDGFKPVNDAYGHAAGDEALVALGQRIHPVLRARDTLGRIGGDEFVILFEDISPDIGARAAVDKILAAVDREPFRIAGDDHQLTLSVGVALFPGDAQESSALLRCADSAMYRAKKTRGTSVAFYAR